MIQGLPIIEASRAISDTLHSVGLLWTRDQPDTETSTWQHTTLTTDKHAPDGFRTRNPSQRAAADVRLRPRGHRDRQYTRYRLFKHPVVTSTERRVSTLHDHHRCFLHQKMIGSRLWVYCFILQYYVWNYPIKKPFRLNVSMKYLCSSILLLSPTTQSSCGVPI